MNRANDITSLDNRLDSLSASERVLFERFYSLQINKGLLRVPAGMREWAVKQFGSVEAVEDQTIVRIANRITGEETIFNSLRALKPCDTPKNEDVAIDRLDSCGDTFANPLAGTTEDTFGRIKGKHCITASNIAKCEELHGLVIFDEFNPLKWAREEIDDYIETGWRWGQKAHEAYPQNKYFFFCWNCMWRSGASINHGHAQMTLSRQRAYSRIESLRKSALAYRRRHTTNYFDDLFMVHRSLDLAVEKAGTRIMASLTPVKKNEILIMSSSPNPSFKSAVYETLALYRDRFGVTSFNLAITAPPLDRTRESWQGFPVMAWMVDRGRLEYRSSDIGSLELFAANSVSSDPFKLAREIKTRFREK